ncbi:hypothetical protein [Thiosulfatihalobacter marinus]|jgi:hypothetical protein|nr:hypothetical protein [Thiosulfatihalobacter marinus]
MRPPSPICVLSRGRKQLIMLRDYSLDEAAAHGRLRRERVAAFRE